MITRLTLCLAGLLLCTHALAHREQESLTTIVWNPRSEMVEIIHRIHQHDAQDVLNKLANLDKESRDIVSLKGKAHIALLVEKALEIKLNDKTAKILFVGAELDGEFILVLQEFALADAEQLTIRFMLFDSVISDYTSRVTILLKGMNKTLFFTSTDSIHTVALPADKPQPDKLGALTTDN